jgi:hypothetical protein
LTTGLGALKKVKPGIWIETPPNFVSVTNKMSAPVVKCKRACVFDAAGMLMWAIFNND